MIIEIKVANFRSINEEQTLSFVADRATRHPDNLIRRPGYRLLKAVGLFGANASGKSNFVKATGAMAAFVRNSATTMNDGDPINAAEPYRLDPKRRDKPSHFEITFVTDGTVYAYGFAADTRRVHEEWLSAKRETSARELFNFRRTISMPQENQECHWSPELKKIGRLIFSRTRDNSLLLSTAARENVTELLPAYRFFATTFWNIDMSYAATTLLAMTAHDCMNDEKLNIQVENLLRDADTDVSNIHSEFGRQVEPTYSTLPSGTISRRAPKINVTYSQLAADGEAVEFDLQRHGSTGTQHLYGLAGVLLTALKRGDFISVDELDASMHPLLTRKLIELFQSPQANPNGAQLLFTTHDPSLLDQELFRRDQVWLAEKCNGASTFFSLADIEPPIRNTESFLRNYLTGRYGGTPHFGPAFDNVLTGAKA